MRAARLRVVFGWRPLQCEMVAVFGANELDQFIGKAELAKLAHAGRNVAAQGDNITNAVVAVFIENGADIVAAGPMHDRCSAAA